MMFSPGCCNCGSAACSTTITVTLLPMGDATYFCNPPGDIFYSIQGTTSGGIAVKIDGKASVAANGGTATFGLLYTSTQLPEGTYTIHVYEKAAICGQPYGETGHFDGSTSFDVKCPKTIVNLDIHAAFDLLQSGGAAQVAGCGPTADSFAAAQAMTITPSISGPATICDSSFSVPGFGGQIGLSIKVTGYPFTVRFDASAPGCRPTWSGWKYTACNVSTPLRKNGGVLLYSKYQIAVGYINGLGMAGATVTAWGAMSGTGTTGANGGGYLDVTGSAYDDPDGPEFIEILQHWEISKPGCRTVRFTRNQITGRITQGDLDDGSGFEGSLLGATFCPMGGRLFCDGGSYDDNTSAPMAMAMPHFPLAAPLPPSPTLRVGLITAHLLLGGAEEHQIILVDGLKTLLGDLITFVGAVNLGQSNPAMRADLAALMPVSDGMEAARDLASRCDVIISWAVLDYAGLYRGLATPPRTVFLCHLPSAWGAATADMLAPVDTFVAVSALAQAPVPSLLKLRSPIIWNAIDETRLTTSRTRAQVRANWGVPAAAKVVGYIGRLSPEKDPDAAYRLAVAMPSVTVVAVGDGPLLSTMKAGAPGNLKIVGPDSDQGSVYAACDTILVPSQYESFGLTMAEAAWLGIPVISTPTGLATIRPGLTRTVPIGANGSILATAVVADAIDPIATAKRVADAKVWTKANLTLDRMARQYAAVLATLAPVAVATKITALLNGVIGGLLSSPAPPADDQLRLYFEVENCRYSTCGCPASGTRDCSHPAHPDRVYRSECLTCPDREIRG